MKKILVLAAAFAASVASAADAVPAPTYPMPEKPGPATSVQDFFGKYVDCTIPALKDIPAKMAAGDEAGANKIFADYVRATLDPMRVNREWYEGSLTKKGKADMRRQVERIMDYRLSACGVPYHFKEHKVDWLFNPTYNGYREWPWQLGRQPFFTELARYYTMMGGDEKAAETWRDMVSSWIAQGGACPEDAPPGRPVMWRTLDSGLRVAGWCKQIHAFVKSPSLSDEFIVRFFRSIRDHGHRLEKPLTSNNWRIMELDGLVHIAMLFPFLTESASWRESSLKEYEKQMDLQIYPDGFQFELAPGYHGILPHDYGKLRSLALACGMPEPPFILKGLERAYDMYPHITRPDRCAPPINDSGAVAIKGPLLTASKLYPAREDFKWFATEGKEGRPPSYLSYAFPYAGAVAFRSSWDRDAVWADMDCSPFGRGHQHEDKLNVLISAYGKNLVVESGCYAYDGSEMRKYVLSTRAHNTIMVDGLEQCTRRGWKWLPEDIYKKADFIFSTTPEVDVARDAYVKGYGRGKVPVKATHARTTIFFKKVPGLAPFFVVVDRLTAPDDKPHTYDSLWHLETSELKVSGVNYVADFGGGIGLSVAFSDAEAKIVDLKGTHEPYQGWLPISPPGPHEHRPVPTPVLKGTFTGAKRVVVVFYPYRDGANRVAGVKAAADVADRNLTLVLTDGTELPLTEPLASH